MVAILPRTSWGATRPVPGGRAVPLSSRRFYVVHWPGTTAGADPAAMIRGIDSAHARQGWAVIGYNFLVSRDGRVWEGCGRDVRGIHSPPRNTDGFGVCCLISINETPPQPLLDATRALYDQLSAQCGRQLARSWHSADAATQCPGPQLTAWVRGGMLAGPAPPPTPPPGPIRPPVQPAPAFPGRLLRNIRPMMQGADVRTWQSRMRERTWRIDVDGWYGPQSESVCRAFQRDSTANNWPLADDGIVGPLTWRASWERPVS
jgi:hypothetical protein